MLPFRVCWEGITKGNPVSLGSLGGLEPIRKGSKFFATFFKKSWGMSFAFANALLRGGRTAGFSNHAFARMSQPSDTRPFENLNFNRKTSPYSTFSTFVPGK